MQAIDFHNVSAGGGIHDVSFVVEAGSLAALVASNQEICDAIVRLLLGLKRPASGCVTVLGSELAVLADNELPAMRRRVAVVHPSGGLISNLKVWENVLLPLEYHSSLASLDLEELGTALLRQVGYEGKAMELPGHLSLYSRRLVGQARAFSMEPELIVYNGVLTGLSGQENRRIIKNAVDFHRGKGGRTSLFLTSQAETVRELPLDARLTVEEGKRI